MILNFKQPRVHFFHFLLFLTSFFSVFAADADPTNTLFGQSLFTTRAIVGAIFILLGLFLVFSGEAFMKVILFIGGAFLFGILSFVLARYIVGDLNAVSESKRNSVYIASAVVALIGGVTALCCYNLGLIIIGGLLGFVLSNLVIRTNVVTGNTGQIILIIVFIVVFALLTFFFSKLIVGIASAFIGATIVMYGIDMFALTGFGNYLISLKSNGDVTPASAKVWAMLVSTVVLAGLGIIVQFCAKRR